MSEVKAVLGHSGTSVSYISVPGFDMRIWDKHTIFQPTFRFLPAQLHGLMNLPTLHSKVLKRLRAH